MAQTYDEIQQQIQRLQQRAETLRSAEVKEVVDKIKVAISHYGLTADQLGFGGKGSATKPKAQVAKSSAPAKPRTGNAQFSDLNGNEWGGRGPRPKWLRDALQAGRDLNEFRIGRRAKPKKPAALPAAANTAVASSTPATSPPPVPAKAPSRKKRVAKVQYSDGADRTWSGMGPKPGWLKSAIEAGKSLADFAK